MRTVATTNAAAVLLPNAKRKKNRFCDFSRQQARIHTIRRSDCHCKIQLTRRTVNFGKNRYKKHDPTAESRSTHVLSETWRAFSKNFDLKQLKMITTTIDTENDYAVPQ